MPDASAPDPGTPDPSVALHVGQLLQPVPGGIGRYTAMLAERLRAAGVPLTGFAAGPRPAALDRDVDYTPLGRPRGRWHAESWLWLRRPAVRVPADLVHAPSLAVPPRGDRPLVVTVHDVAFLRLPEYFTVHGLRFHERGLSLARRHADAIVVPSRFVATELEREGFEAERVHVALHGMDLPPERDPAEVSDALRRLGVHPPYVLFVGTLEPRKGVATLVEAHRILRRHHPDVTLVVVGARGWGKVPSLDLPGVIATGSILDEHLDVLYRGAAALAYPSRYEGFGLPALEAMARGCPVVTSGTTSLPEVVGDAGVLVDPEDPEAIAGALAAVVGDEDRRASLAEAGRRRAAEFTWDKSVAAHRAAYRAALSVLGGATSPPD